MFNILQKKLNKAFELLKGKKIINEENITNTLKEIHNALIYADVNYHIAKDFIKKIKNKVIYSTNIIDYRTYLIKIVYNELTNLMGGNNVDINLLENPNIILIVGLQGSGKTTFSVKLARFLKIKKHKNPLLVAADVYRPAAINQINILGTKVNVPVFSIKNNKDPVDIIIKSIEQAKVNNNNVIIIDTAGRLSVNKFMMNEIKNIYNSIKPTDTLFIIDAMIGQDAINIAKSFNNEINFDGVVLTKLDSDARGGAALTVCSVINKPIKFISTGENMESISVFYPNRMASRILGMGDIVSLVEKVKEQFDETQVKNIQEKIEQSTFNFNDFLEHIKKIKKMGNIKDIIEMIPGTTTNINIENFSKIEAIIYSMTPMERQKPLILNKSRKIRIAKGSGTSIEDINNIISKFSYISNMLKPMKNISIKDALSMIKSKFSNQ
ncbi:MAG: signal recognition particle protein [Candidatus Bostrichicola ureolyticus]|nr:MAG: signal recognition particle protein [Candidatus Bostrichicola ureolyticus]